MNIDPRNANFTIDQIRELMTGSCHIYNVKPGDTVTWTCGHIDPDTHQKCDFTFNEYPDVFIEHAEWPERLIEHIWKNGHITVTSNGRSYSPYSAPQKPPEPEEPLLRLWLRGMKYLLLCVGLPLLFIFLMIAYAKELFFWLLMGIVVVIILVILPFQFGSMFERKKR